MAKIPEKVVEEVVGEVSQKMADPTYAQIAIGGFAQAHPDVGRFITAHLEELGGGEGVMHAVFHAEVLNECFRRHHGRSLSPVGFEVLDMASKGDPTAKLEKLQPGLAAYVASNVESEPMRRLLALIGVAMDEMS